MTKPFKLFATVFISALLLSCAEQKGNEKHINQETPEALQDNYVDLKSFSRAGKDLTEELYQELVDKTPALKKLEAEIKGIGQKTYTLQDEFNTFESKSNNYYTSSNNRAMAISDSVLKTKITSLITASQKKYTSQTSELNSLINQISKNSLSLNDRQTALKILLTLPIIEQYQKDKLPGNEKYKTLTREQETLISQLDSLTP